MSQTKDTYFVAVKVFLRKGNQLLIMKDKFGDWDLPGGRIKKDEFDVPLEDVVARKMREELGINFTYTLGKPVVFMRHERVERAPGGPTVRIFAVGYEATFEGGTLAPSERHLTMVWVNVGIFKPEEYFTGGWLMGVKEYLIFAGK